jgi:hypothetical protein
VLNDDGDFVGFDVLIGNPPYIGIEDITWDYRRFYETIYKTATGRFDLYSLFIEKAMQIKQPTGVFTYIIPGKFLNNKQFVTARKIVCDNHGVTVVKIDDKVFEDAQVDSVIVENYPATKAIYKAFKITMQELQSLSETEVTNILNDKEIIFRLEINTKFDNLISKIEKDTLKVKEIADVKDGIVAGTIKDLLYIDKKKDKDCHKLYFGKHLFKYSLNDTGVWVNYKPEEMMKEEVKRKNGKRAGLWMRDEKIFKREKILSRFVAKEIIATYDNDKRYYEHTLHSTHITDKRFKTKYVLGLYNSTLFKFYYRKTNSQGGDIFPQVRISSVENLPIKLADTKTQEKIETIVDQICQRFTATHIAKSHKPHTQAKTWQRVCLSDRTGPHYFNRGYIYFDTLTFEVDGVRHRAQIGTAVNFIHIERPMKDQFLIKVYDDSVTIDSFEVRLPKERNTILFDKEIIETSYSHFGSTTIFPTPIESAKLIQELLPDYLTIDGKVYKIIVRLIPKETNFRIE